MIVVAAFNQKKALERAFSLWTFVSSSTIDPLLPSQVHLMYEQVGVSDPAPRLRNPVVRVVSMETAEAREVVEVPDLSTGLYLLCAELRAPRGLPRVLQSTCFTARVHTSTSQAEQGRYWTHKIKVLYLTIPDLNNSNNDLKSNGQSCIFATNDINVTFAT